MNDVTEIFNVSNLLIQRNGTTVLDIPELKIHKGEIFSIMGPNGSGKTTLLQSLMLLIQITNGDIYFNGKKINLNNSTYKYRRNFAMVFQEPLLFNTTVFKNIASGLEIRGMSRKETEMKVDLQLERFEISHLKKRSARALSGGEAQRVSLARAFALEPAVLLLDEPFTALDIPTHESIIEDLERVLRETHTTTVFATHDRMEALRLSNRMAIISNGRILQLGTAYEVMNKPINELVASFTGTEIILTGNVKNVKDGHVALAVEGKELEIAGDADTGEKLTIGLRPENIFLSEKLTGKISARNTFTGKITKIIPMEFYCKIYIDCGFMLVSYITGHSLDNLSLREGKEITVSFKATAVHIIKREKTAGEFSYDKALP